jgi:hypothetical protein
MSSVFAQLYDSVTPTDIPLTVPAVAGYIDGLYRWPQSGWDRFGTPVKVRITVAGAQQADVADVENGDMTITDAIEWVSARLAAHLPQSVVYCSAATWPSIRAAFDAHGVAAPWWWIADWNGRSDIPDGADAHQYITPPASGGHFDISVISPRLWALWNGDPMAITQDDANLIVSTLLDWKIVTPSAGPGVGRAVWDVLGDSERIIAALSVDTNVIENVIKNMSVSGVDVTTLASMLTAQLAPVIKASELSPAEFFTALAEQLKK